MLVAADSAVVRAGLEAVLALSPALTVVGGSSGGDQLAIRIGELQPDVVLLELDPHADDSVPASHTLGDGTRHTAFVILADDPRGGWAADALRSGARAVLPRAATADEIVAAVEAAAVGLVVLHADILATLLPAQSSLSRTLPAPPAQALTPREIEVLNMLAEGLGNKAIAPRLGITEHTVKAHVASIFAKLGASSRTEAVTLGARLGVIML